MGAPERDIVSLEHRFLRVKCDACQAEKLVAFSCKRRGFCPSCGARRMVETAALLVDNILPPGLNSSQESSALNRLPVLVIAPCLRFAPVVCSEGTRPR